MTLKNNLRLILAVSALIALIGFRIGKPWRWSKPKSNPTGNLVVAETKPEPRSTPTMEAFQQTMVRDVATTSFRGMFDLLRSATKEQRLNWLKQLDEMPLTSRRTIVLSNFYKTFVQLDPHAAAESITTLGDKGTQALVAGAMAEAAPQSAMGEMAAMLIKLPDDAFPRGTPPHLMYVIRDWSSIDPLSTAQFLEANPKLSELYAGDLLDNWARSDPEAARAWLAMQPDTVQTENAFQSLFWGWFERDEAAALNFQVEHAADPKLRQSINDTARGLFSRSPNDARTFLLRLPGKVRDEALSGLSGITSETFDPAIPWERKAEEVVRWAVTLPEESWNELLPTALEHWDSQDPGGFAHWLDQLPTTSRDSIVEMFCLSRRSLENDIPLLNTINDPVRRDKAIREYVSRLSCESRTKAIRKIKHSNLSDVQQRYLIERIP